VLLAQQGSAGSIRIRYQNSAPPSGNFRACTALFPTDPNVVRDEKAGNGGGALIAIQASKHEARRTCFPREMRSARSSSEKWLNWFSKAATQEVQKRLHRCPSVAT